MYDIRTTATGAPITKANMELPEGPRGGAQRGIAPLIRFSLKTNCGKCAGDEGAGAAEEEAQENWDEGRQAEAEEDAPEAGSR